MFTSVHRHCGVAFGNHPDRLVRIGRLLTKRLLIFLIALAPSVSLARDWHVSNAGNDDADGTTPATAFRSLQKAAGLVEPGDTVLIGDGTYTYTSPPNAGGSAVLKLTRSGRPEAWITWRAAPGARPEIRFTGWGGIEITASYQIIDGLSVTGGNDALTLLDALADAKNLRPNPRFNGNGITIDGRKSAPDAKPHHIIIRRATVAKCPGAGIAGLEMDHLTVEDCQVFENSWYCRYAASGITTLNNWTFDDAPGYHIVIRRNLVWNNKTLVPWERTGKLSDGNGILLDVTDVKKDGATNPNGDAVISPPPAAASASASTPTPAPTSAPAKPTRPEWKARALIANNVSAYNGGSGIHTFRTRHVDIVNNTTYWNGQVVGYQELFSNQCTDVVMLNNIIVPRPGGKVTSNSRNTDVRWDYNLYPAAQSVLTGPHDLVADPRFVSIHPDLREADFRLRPDSPARASGSPELPQPTDLAGLPRPADRAPNRGAYEQTSP